MEKVLVLLSTYNGERYLETQLNSILQQEGVEVNILIRDDGSTDRTLDLLHAYQKRASNVFVLEEENRGSIQSFYKLMDYARTQYDSYDYYAFSDQDDYWLPDKLFRAVSMNKNHSDNYLYHSCYEVVDADLNLIFRLSTGHTRGTLGEALISNYAIGCSEVFTYKVLEQSASICDYSLEDKKYYPYHDLWVYLVALATKADVVFDDYCGLKYRQHGHNVIGTGRSKTETRKAQFRNLMTARNLKSGFARILLDLLHVDEDVREELLKVSTYRSSLRGRISLASDKNFRTESREKNIAFILSVLGGSF